MTFSGMCLENTESQMYCKNGVSVSNRKIRVLIAKPGLDGHDRGVKVLVKGLRDAGMEVTYIGLHLTPDQIAEATAQEDVDVVCLSCLSGAHMALFPEIADCVRDKCGKDILFIGGGIIPNDDASKLQEAGFARTFGPGTLIEEVVKFIEESFPEAGFDNKD